MKIAMSVKMLEGINIFRGALEIIKHYKENYDGTGFPDKLKGEEIPLTSRILLVASTVEDLRMSSGFKGDELKENTLKQLQSGAGTRFDPKIVQVIAELFEEHKNSFWII
jgi:response regulator RpfG family c-di-GMP phosphodiesterase